MVKEMASVRLVCMTGCTAPNHVAVPACVDVDKQRPAVSQVEVPSEGDEAADGVAIDGKLLSLRKQSGTLRVVNGRGLRRGDTVICDFDARADSAALLHAAMSLILLLLGAAAQPV